MQIRPGTLSVGLLVSLLFVGSAFARDAAAPEPPTPARSASPASPARPPEVDPGESVESPAAAEASTPAASVDPIAELNPFADGPVQPVCLPLSGPHVGLGLDVVPFVGTSGAYRGTEVRSTSLNAIGGLTGGVDGVELSTVFNIVTHSVRGLQATGAVNVVARCVDGVQLAGSVNVAGGRVSGAQLAGGANVAGGALDGAQLAGGLSLATGSMDGAQLSGGANVAAGFMDGVQIAGGLNLATGDLDGVQVVGGANLTPGRVDGVQIAGGVNLAGGSVDGAQIAGGVNLARGVDGAQIGAVNVSGGDVRGIQIGVLNFAEDSDVSLGVVNVIWKGRWHLDLWTSDTGLYELGLENGGRYSHNIYSFGFKDLGDRRVYSLGLGFGLHFPVASRLHLDLDGLVRGLYESSFRHAEDHVNLLSTLRLVAGIEILDGLTVFGGPTLNALVSDDFHGEDFSRFGLEVEQERGCRRHGVYTWPGFVVGLQLL